MIVVITNEPGLADIQSSCRFFACSYYNVEEILAAGYVRSKYSNSKHFFI